MGTRQNRPASSRASLLLTGAVLAALVWPADGEARERVTKQSAAADSESRPWCAPDVEALSEDVCYVDGGGRGDRRTLVVFLHGAIAKDTTWQWTQERGILRLARYHGFEAIIPRSPQSEVGYVWPGTAEAQERDEAKILEGWTAAKLALEKRDGRPFDEVFVMGFSSGAYFVSSLAMRGRADVDGYAAFAGGQATALPSHPVFRWSPVFVGVCADDSSASHSRAFAGALAGAGIPRTVNEQHVGHGISEIHFAHALSFLRRTQKAR